MPKGKGLSRDRIILELVNALRPLDYVYAFWECGAAAFGRVDEWSDIDVNVVVDDNKIDETFSQVEKALAMLSPIKLKYEVPKETWQDMSQAFYKLEKASDYHLIDLAVLKLSKRDKFLEPRVHGNLVFYFKKGEKISPAPLDVQEFNNSMQKRLLRLKARFDIFNCFVQKEINRKNYLEALDLYYNVTLSSLVEILRMMHNPFHYDFKMRYVHYELPPDVIKRLEWLYSVRGLEDLQGKYEEASTWFSSLAANVPAGGSKATKSSPP
jgi:predicted nucleotidyltransferase